MPQAHCRKESKCARTINTWAQAHIAWARTDKGENHKKGRNMAKNNCEHCFYWQGDDYCITEIFTHQPCKWFVDSEEVYKYLNSCGQAMSADSLAARHDQAQPVPHE
ncbi:MAG: hypothetical protein FJ264_11715 [Planctomycetes bacterium]|nr:hypothetical protein [Planctomycetota bacterium]